MQSNQVNEEGKLLKKTRAGTIYTNAASPEDIRKANALRDRVSDQLISLANERGQDPKTSLSFRYDIGQALKNALEKENVPAVIRKEFWNEVDNYVDPGHIIPRPGGQSSSSESTSRHSFFEVCYLIATNFTKEEALKFTWRQLNSLIDRPIAMQHRFILEWCMDNIGSIKDQELREVLKAATAYGKNHDLDIFEKEDLYEKMDFFLAVEKEWQSGLNTYFSGKEKNMSAARRKEKTKYKGKYIQDCLAGARFAQRVEWHDICDQSFRKTYVDVNPVNTKTVS